VKKSLKTLIDNAYLLHKGNKIVLFLFDHECTRHEFTMSDEGYAAALQFVQEIRHRGTTNIIKVCHDMRTYVDGLVASGIAPEHIMKTFLTDGHHYDREGSTTIDMLIAPPPIIVGDSEEEVVEEYDSKVRGIPVKKSFTRMEYYFRLELNESELGELAGFRETLLKDWIDKVEPRITRADSWVPSSTSKTSSDINENWEDITKGQGWLYGRKWRYGEDNSWGIQEWDGD
jgi:hypothetical protein